MDERRFDALTRLFATVVSRRRGAGVLLAALAAPVWPAADAAGRRRNAKGKHRNRDRNDRRDQRQSRKKRKRKNRGGAAAAQCCNRQDCAPGKGKNLGRCCFADRDLTAANFQGANLGGASFARADLTGATFRGANLDQTCFVDANTTGTRFGNANRGTAIFCRTETSSGIDNSGCNRGTPCCPTCDAAHPCGQGHVCCAGRCLPGNCCDNNERSTCQSGQICCGHRCVDGDCCETADCPNEICQRRACRDNTCVYTPVFGEPGPRCPDPRLCCQDEQGAPLCCAAGVMTCAPSGGCGCAANQDCPEGQTCRDGQCGVACGADFCPADSEICDAGTCRACDVCADGCAFATVQAAIDAAAPGAVIRICAGTYGRLGSGPVANIGKNLTLRGAGSGPGGTRLDGGGIQSFSDAVVEIGFNSAVQLQHLTVTGANETAGIDNFPILGGTTLTLEGVVVTGNSNSSSTGGISNSGTLVLNAGASVTKNTAGVTAGGIWNLGTLIMNAGSSVTDNTAGGDAGGVFNLGGTMTMNSGSSVTGNKAGGRGGGIFNSGMLTRNAGSSVTGNMPTDCVNIGSGTGC